MKQSSKPYGIAKPHIMLSTSDEIRYFVYDMSAYGYMSMSGHGKCIGAAWSDFKNQKAKHEKGKRDMFWPKPLASVFKGYYFSGE